MVAFSYMVDHTAYHQDPVSGPSELPVEKGVHAADDEKCP
jgi:hypothetical protein